MTFDPRPAVPALLAGDPCQRGRAQANLPDTDAVAVRAAIALRLDQGAAALSRPEACAFIAEQDRLLRELDPDGAAELDGIAEGFGLPSCQLLAYLHLGVVAEIAEEGCSTFAHAGAHAGERPAPLLAKNRDYRGEHAALQRVFLHRDPARPDRDMLCVGSLGSPGAFSSGMNAHGLALVDTAVATRDHGPGLLRYFLMTRLLRQCRDVPEALAEIARLPHAGGGTVTLADAAGRHAAVEFGHRRTAVENDPAPFRARTNHFLLEGPREAFVAGAQDAGAANTHARLVRIRRWLAALTAVPSPDDAARLMAGHAEGDRAALCRHGEDGGSGTISSSLFAPATRTLYFCPGNPCSGRWFAYGLDRAAEVMGVL
jgi:isopenicillin-N N-acyltransferase like protein